VKRRILLVDDHEVVRKGLGCLLDPKWEVCGEAANGAEAVQKVHDLNPDLVLLDLNMPVMGGMATALAIRNIAPDIKIVFFSMHDTQMLEQMGRLVHVDAFLTKGCTGGKLNRTIAHLLHA
jgi:DNA-binding NarL/FixJ family response regulator